MKKVELKVQDVSQGTMTGNPYLVILKETGGCRKLSVMVGAMEAQAILVAMRGVMLPRPLLHDVMTYALESYDIELKEVFIFKVEDGVYYSTLVLEQDGNTQRIEARTSDAIAMALRLKAPIYTHASLIEREHIYDDGNGSISIPISSVSLNVLHEALKRAIREENYELAAQLRDEIARRTEK